MAARLVLLAALAAFAAGSGAPGTAAAKPWLWQCARIQLAEAKFRCNVRLLLEEVRAARDPAAFLPRLDARARGAGDALQGSCHALMHEVGRRYARERGVTLSTLQRYIPRSNDPTCSAGFGMGLVMHLGSRIVRSGGTAALATCLRLPTRYRSYTCVHGIGHAVMRGFHGDLRSSVAACRRLRVYRADCAQGAFHDYWIALRGADGTTLLRGADSSPRSVCNGRFFYVRPCWYRYFVEQPGRPGAEDADDLVRTCRGLRRLQRSGCIAAEALTLSSDPVAQLHVCARLGAVDALSCTRGAAVQAVAGSPARQRVLLGACTGFRRAARDGCYAWLGRTLEVVTDGRFSCAILPHSARRSCRAGAARRDAALLTFS